MQDLEGQLARYGTVLRGRVPAVGLDEVEDRLGQPPPGHRPIRAAAAGALLVLASIGAVIVGSVLLGLVGTKAVEPSAVSPASGAVSGPAVMTLVAGAGALTVLVGAAAVGMQRSHRARQPQREARRRQRRKRAMQTIEKPVAPVERLERTNRYLIIALVVAVLLAAGLGAWLIVDNARTATERDINALLDDSTAAWEANDGAAVLGFTTQDATFTAGNGVTYSRDQLEPLVDSLGSFSVERIGDPLIMEVDQPDLDAGWFVAEVNRIELAGQVVTEMALTKVVERDGEYLIAYHESWIGR